MIGQSRCFVDLLGEPSILKTDSVYESLLICLGVSNPDTAPQAGKGWKAHLNRCHENIKGITFHDYSLV